MSVILQDISKVSQVNNISSPKPSLILPRGFTHSPTSQQQNLSIKIDTTTQEYHCDDQRLRDGSIGVSISHLCHCQILNSYILSSLYSDVAF